MMFGQKENRILGFNDLKLFLAQMLLYAFLAMAIMFPDLLLSGSIGIYFLQWSEALMYMIIYLIGGRYFYIYLAHKYPGYQNRKKRFPRLFLILVLYGLITLLLQLTLQPLITITVPGYQEDRVLKEVIMGTFFALFGVGLYESIYLFVQLKDEQIRLKSIEKQKVQNQLEILKHQLSPHFLFNCFNALSHLIDEDKTKGKEFVNDLAVLHKKILELSARETITLQEEMEYTRAYINLLKKRFGDNLDFQTFIDIKDLKRKIIPLALQMAIENAIKHNIITKKNPLTISIYLENEYVVVKNDLQPKSLSLKTQNLGLGLKNIAQRFKMLGNKEIKVKKTPKYFFLKLPLLTHDT